MRLLGAFCVIAGLAIAQPPDREIPIVTVCDVLSDLARYNGKSIFLIGEAVVSDSGEWIVADCAKSLVTDGFTLPDSIEEAKVREQNMRPPEMPNQFKWNNKLIATKLHELKRTTRFDRNHTRWIVVFGRLDANAPPGTFFSPTGNLTGFGFGPVNGAWAQIMLPVDFHRAWRNLH